MSALVWNDATGYYCPRCHLNVCIPKRASEKSCPRCPPDVPVDEQAFAALRRAGLDEADAATALTAVLPFFHPVQEQQ